MRSNLKADNNKQHLINHSFDMIKTQNPNVYCLRKSEEYINDMYFQSISCIR